LAYGLAALVVVLVTYVLVILFRSEIHGGFLWLILLVILAPLLAFVFLDWNQRRPTTSSSVLYIVVHEEGDQTSVIADADVTLALPEPVIKRTAANGAANFTIPGELMGREFSLNARKDGYDVRRPVRVFPHTRGDEFIPLMRKQGAKASVDHSEMASNRAQTSPSPDALGLVYDSEQEGHPFESWVRFSNRRENKIEVIENAKHGLAAYRITAVAKGKAGVNKSFPTRYGRIEFDYRVEASDSSGTNIFVYLIPMQETGFRRSGLIEVGTDVEEDPRNAFSPYRVRFLVPRKHYGDGLWHHGTQEFDFREIPEAFYSIFGPRINEGSTDPASGTLLLTNIKLFSHEV